MAETEEQALEYLADSIQRMEKTDNFNRVGGQLVPIAASTQSVTCELTVGPEHVNDKGTLHGGQIISLVDIVTARALGVTVRDTPMVSIDLSASYMLPALLGETVVITAEVLKKGRSICFTECEFRRKTDNKLIAKGKHNIALLEYLKKPNAGQF